MNQRETRTTNERLAVLETNQDNQMKALERIEEQVTEIHGKLHNGLIQEIKKNTEFREEYENSSKWWKWTIRASIVALAGKIIIDLIRPLL